MSSYPFYGYTPPGYAPPLHPPQGHTAQAPFSPAYPTSMQPVQIQPFQVHPAPPILVSEHWIIPGEPLPPPEHNSRRQHSARKAFEAYDYPPPQSKLKDHSRAYGQRRIRPEQSLHPKKAIEYQNQKREADEHAYYLDDGTAVLTGSESSSDTLDENRKETKKSTGPQRVHTKGDSSKIGRVQKYIESQPDAANKQAKGSSASPTGTEREHKTKQSTRATHAKSDSKRRPEKPAKQAKERTSTSTAGTARAHTTGHSSSTKFFIRPGESQSGPNITINQHVKYDPKRWEFGISTPGEKSTGHRSKEKPKESSRGSQSTKPTKEELPDYYDITGCSMDDTTKTISREIKKKQLEVHPDKRVRSDMSEQRIAEINRESALINEAAEVLKDPEKRAAYDQKWKLVYWMGKDGKPVFR